MTTTRTCTRSIAERCLADPFAAVLPPSASMIANARVRAETAMARWRGADAATARSIAAILEAEFPDGASPARFWHDVAHRGFTDFFTWGHDHDFGHGFTRPGAMTTRHLEIGAEAMALGFLPQDLSGTDVLDVGCWSGGDALLLAGLGARVTALEEHPVSAVAAARLCFLVNAPVEVVRRSLYADDLAWAGRFDLVYLSGVVYHLTDPLLALRLCFAYLKPGGRLIVETKASHRGGAACDYAGTSEKGWNWYAPTLESLGRWLVDVGFARDRVQLHMRPIGRLLACAIKGEPVELPEVAGFSRPGSWLEGVC